MIKNLIFDLGGVLIDLDVKQSVEAFKALVDPNKIADAASPVSAMDLLGGGESELVQLYQTGSITTEQFVNTILQVCRPGTTSEQVLDAWCAMLRGLPAHRMEQLRLLKQKGFRVFILSNINEWHVRWTLRKFKEWGMPELDGVYFSNEMHLAKPDPRCYERVISETGIVPAETLYIDDLAQNIAAGQKAGLQCLQAIGDEWMNVVKEIADKFIKNAENVENRKNINCH
ncbi:MAG: HAD family phosphatase [Bacteroidales bacterium]|nr:HAD family phosphatase [Candidatus Colicola coprequi]